MKLKIFFAEKGCGQKVVTRISLGIDGDTWPWIVSIGKYDTDGRWRHFCGGALITPRFVLTGTLTLDEKMTSVVYYSQGFKGYMFSKQPYLIELTKI